MDHAITMTPMAGSPLSPPLTTNEAARVTRVPPIIGSGTPAPPHSRFHAGYVILSLLLCLPMICAVGIAGYFHLGSATRSLRSSVMEAVPGQWNQRFAVHLGSLTMGLVRFGSQFFKLPPEPKAALSALHGAEVGVYKLAGESSARDYSAIFLAADKSMKGRGWERLVGVAQDHQFVAIYAPRNFRSLKSMACAVVVLSDCDLVVASARGNLEPLLEIATNDLHQREHLLAKLSLGK